VFHKFAAGHPKFEAERELRASPWGFALIASRLDAPSVPKKRSLKKKLFLIGQLILRHLDDLVAVDDLAEHAVLAVQPCGGSG
jgi:hypothetical protein